MSESQRKLTVLVPLDGSQQAEVSLVHALALSSVFSSRIFLLQVVGASRADHDHASDSVDWQLRQRQAEAYLRQVTERFEGKPVELICRVESGNPASTIVQFARDNDVDLTILSRIGQTGAKYVGCGGVAQKIVAAIGSSVLLTDDRNVQRVADGHAYKQLIVPVDDSAGAEWAVVLAASIAKLHEARLSLVRVLETPCGDMRLPETSEVRVLLNRIESLSRTHAEQRFAELRAHVPDDVDIAVETLFDDHVADRIARFAEEQEADLIVLCAHGSGGQHPWHYGAVPEFLLAHSATPVLVIQQGDQASVQRYRSIYCGNANLEAG